MPRRKSFLPPLPSPPLLALSKSLLPFLFHRTAGGLEVSTSDSDLSSLRNLRNQRLLLLPNHPTHFDPMVMLELSRRLEQDFFFVAAREVFDRSRAWGWLLQHLGCYSLVRGAVDRDSFTYTQQLLTEGKNPLVIFIEGEVSLENDSALPFESGVVSLALRTQDKLPANQAPIHIVPIAMRTIYKKGVEHAIINSVCRLEEAVGIKPQSHFVDWPTTRTRLGMIGCALLASVEKTYLITPKPTDTIYTRMDTLKLRFLTKMESNLDLPPPKDASITILDRVRTIRNRMDRIVHTYEDGDAAPPTPYDRRLLDRRRLMFAEFYADLARLINFLTLRSDYLDDASPERFAEVTIRLEKEILGHPALLHPRTVHLKIGTPRNLADSLPAFREDKRATAAQITDTLESEMLTLLTQMRRPSQP